MNRRTTSDVRATMHSFLSQAESVGEIGSGFALVALAREAGSSATLVTAAACVALTGAMVAAIRRREVPVSDTIDRGPLRPEEREGAR